MKVYKITLKVSIIILIVFSILAISFNHLDASNKWIGFAINVFVGIACSTALVFITTLIQFKVEQKKIIDKIASATRSLLFHNKIYGLAFEEDTDKSGITDKQILQFKKLWQEEVDKDITEISLLSCEYESFLNKNHIGSLIKTSALLKIAMVKYKTTEETYRQVQNEIFSLAQTILMFNINDYNKDEIKKYITEDNPKRNISIKGG